VVWNCPCGCGYFSFLRVEGMVCVFVGYLVVRRGPTDIMCRFFVVIMFDALLDMLGHLWFLVFFYKVLMYFFAHVLDGYSHF
jgi:hypothetical protein